MNTKEDERQKEIKKSYVRRISAALAAFIPAFILQLLARKAAGFGEWYAVTIYPVLVNTVSRIMSVFPFSVVEFLLYGALFFLFIRLFKGLSDIIRKRKKFFSAAGIFLLDGMVIFGELLLIYTLTCGINYYRSPFSVMADFTIEKSKKEELIQLCEYLTEQINEEAALLNADENGCMVLTVDLREQAGIAMERAGKLYESLSGYYPDPKPVMVSEILSYQYIEGIYSPFTLEANYNDDMSDYNKPVTVCHELSHLKGFMREDEANFIAYLACRESDEVQFRYSGDMLAYLYSMNALYRTGERDEYIRIEEGLCRMAKCDFYYDRLFWESYQGKVAEVSAQVNNTYLKANSQSDGARSYGRMVDLLLALRRQEGGEQ